MKILIFGNYSGGKVFYDELIASLSKEGLVVDMLDWGEFALYENNFSSKIDFKLKYRVTAKLTRIKYLRIIIKILLVKLIIRSIKIRYDVIDIHYGNARNNKYLKQLRSKCHKLTTTIWGSDFHRLPAREKVKAKKLYSEVDCINIGNPKMGKEFIEFYQDYEHKICNAGFGNNKIEIIGKYASTEGARENFRSKLNIDERTLVITCGYKAFHVLQHHKIIDAIVEIIDSLPQNYLLIFPLTYHRDEKYVCELKRRLDENGLQYRCFETFLSELEVVMLRIVSDIYITIPESDAASASLLEYLAANNIVIAGDWLPYEMHSDLGLYFISSSLSDLSSNMKKIVSDFYDYKNKAAINTNLVISHFSWKKQILKWKKMYEQ